VTRLWSLGILSLCLGALSCRDGRTVRANGELLLTPPALELPSTWVGAESSAEVSAINTGSARISVELHLEPPFSLSEDRFELGRGEARPLSITFRPEIEGRFEAVLGDTVRIAGDAVPVPQCPAPTECKQVRFDAARGACVEEAANEGGSCGANNACITGGACVAGQCLGALVDCDDQNACTADSCSPAMGCLHTDVSAECPKPEGVCEIAVCDRQTGCGVGQANDGTACGAADCKTAEVCIAGACVERAVPEGATCGSSSLCRGPGVCHNQTCELPAPSTMTPRWTHVPVGGRQLLFKGNVDLVGNAYFLEPVVTVNDAGYDDWSDLELVSVDRDGTERFREKLAFGCRYSCGYYLNMALDDATGRLYLLLTGNRLQARGLADGKLQWEADTKAGIPIRNGNANGTGSFYTSGLMVLGTSDRVAVTVLEGLNDHWAHVVSYDRATGQAMQRIEKKGHTYGTVSWGSGEYVMSTANCWAPAGEVSRFNALGAQVASQYVTGTIEAATSSSTFVRSYQTSSLVPVSGTVKPLVPPTGEYFGAALMAGDRLLLISGINSTTHLIDFDSTTGSKRWNVSLSPSAPGFTTMPELALMDDGTVFASGAAGTSGAVATFDTAGKEVTRCALSAAPASPPAIRLGRYVVQLGKTLQSFDVGNLDTSRTGWAGVAGGPSRDAFAH
jgi:hypothetical protein